MCRSSLQHFILDVFLVYCCHSSYMLQLRTRKHMRSAHFGNFPAARVFVYQLERCKTSWVEAQR